MAPAEGVGWPLPRHERLLIRLQRARRWEFWPGWLLYIPVVAWILFCGIRYRHWTAFTAANPGMDNGSVVGERKSRTLLPLQQRLPDSVPETHLIVPGDELGMATVNQLAERYGWPVVLKPDIGQRGRGVALIRNGEQARAYLESAAAAGFATLAQAYVEGIEYGVFVRRIPGTRSYEISSLTHKALPRLRGDGSSSLATLIRQHPRAWLISELLYQRHARRLADIIPAGQEFQLVELGAHCRGSEFRNAMDRLTPALLARMQEIAEAIPGFDFGRIDLRCPSAAALSDGHGLQVLEVNGVTSEPAHLYHPGTPLFTGLAGFCEHWTRAFALGNENRRYRRATTVAPLHLLRLFRDDLARFDACEAAAQAAMQAPTPASADAPINPTTPC